MALQRPVVLIALGRLLGHPLAQFRLELAQLERARLVAVELVEDLLDLGLEGVEAEDANELRKLGNLDLAVPVLIPLLEQLHHACS